MTWLVKYVTFLYCSTLAICSTLNLYTVLECSNTYRIPHIGRLLNETIVLDLLAINTLY